MAGGLHRKSVGMVASRVEAGGLDREVHAGLIQLVYATARYADRVLADPESSGSRVEGALREHRLALMALPGADQEKESGDLASVLELTRRTG